MHTFKIIWHLGYLSNNKTILHKCQLFHSLNEMKFSWFVCSTVVVIIISYGSVSARKFAMEAIKDQKALFRSWGVMADWEDGCYFTFEKSYVKNQLQQFYKLYKQVRKCLLRTVYVTRVEVMHIWSDPLHSPPPPNLTCCYHFCCGEGCACQCKLPWWD